MGMAVTMASINSQTKMQYILTCLPGTITAVGKIFMVNGEKCVNRFFLYIYIVSEIVKASINFQMKMQYIFTFEMLPTWDNNGCWQNFYGS